MNMELFGYARKAVGCVCGLTLLMVKTYWHSPLDVKRRSSPSCQPLCFNHFLKGEREPELLHYCQTVWNYKHIKYKHCNTSYRLDVLQRSSIGLFMGGGASQQAS